MSITDSGNEKQNHKTGHMARKQKRIGDYRGGKTTRTRAGMYVCKSQKYSGRQCSMGKKLLWRTRRTREYLIENDIDISELSKHWIKKNRKTGCEMGWSKRPIENTWIYTIRRVDDVKTKFNVETGYFFILIIRPKRPDKPVKLTSPYTRIRFSKKICNA